MNTRIETGQQGEQAVVQFLVKEGFAILEQNFRQRYGEIDIIASRGDVISFIEVKTRTTEYFPTSLVITRPKQQKIIRTARYYASYKKIQNKMLRFDVAIVTGRGNTQDIRYIPNAFTQ